MAFIRKWSATIWVCLIAVVAAYGVYRQPVSFGEIAARISVAAAAVALVLIVFGKAMTVALVRFTLCSAREDRGWLYAWRAYSLADISKYLPGGIWGIAGRVALYKQAGIELSKCVHILLAETALLISFSFATGAAALFVARDFGDRSVNTIVIVGTVVGLLVAVSILLRRLPFLLRVVATATTALSWLAFGLSFALIAATTPTAFIEMGGRFNVGFAAGQLAIFAPSGIGVREAVVAWFASDTARESARVLVELVVVHRLIWLGADFLVLLPVLVLGAGGAE